MKIFYFCHIFCFVQSYALRHLLLVLLNDIFCLIFSPAENINQKRIKKIIKMIVVIIIIIIIIIIIFLYLLPSASNMKKKAAEIPTHNIIRGRFRSRVFFPGKKRTETLEKFKKFKNMNLTQQQLSLVVGASQSTISRYLAAEKRHKFRRNPRYHSSIFPELIAAVLRNPGENPISSLNGLRLWYERITSERFSVQAFASFLCRNNYRKLRSSFEDPRKFRSIENRLYYAHYLGWMKSLAIEDALRICFFDEARFELTGRFSLKILFKRFKKIKIKKI